jgi:hypothetical protein
MCAIEKLPWRSTSTDRIKDSWCFFVSLSLSGICLDSSNHEDATTLRII